MRYRHRPSFPALIGALLVFSAGTSLVLYLRPEVEAGEISASSMLLAGCFTCAISGALLVMAFARYPFTQLWISTGASHSNKYKKRRRAKPAKQ